MNREEINDHYRNISEENCFPFVGDNYITILKKGLYAKKKANYRGVSYIRDPDSGKYKAVLLGYYEVNDDYIVVPPELTINESKQTLIDKYLGKGYKLVTKCPSLKPVSFEEGTVEHKVALESHKKFIERL
tara:strand:- start:1571 stop:1963 length:393 start_codon:yes stop_codon:yes gene_type:complete